MSSHFAVLNSCRRYRFQRGVFQIRYDDIVFQTAGTVIGNGHNRNPCFSLNLPNHGTISNLPEGAIVETPGSINAEGISGTPVGELPEGITELLRREITVSHLTVDAVVEGDRSLALQALLLDSVIRDIDMARKVLDDYLEAYKTYLPTFWR